MKGNGKLACGALSVSLISGILALIYLAALGGRETGTAGLGDSAFVQSLPVLGILAGIMMVSTLVMIFALCRKKR